MRRIMFYIFLIVTPIYTGVAATVSDEIKKAWGYSSLDISNGAPGDFVVLGGTGTGSDGRGPIECSYVRGNQSAAYGTVGVVARQVVKHGAYFCPTQVVCDSRADRDPDKVHFAWYNPATHDSTNYEKKGKHQTEISTTNCHWLCDDGYYGTECKETNVTTCDNSQYVKPTTDSDTASGVFGAIRMRRNHDRKPKEGIAQVSCFSVSKIDSQIPLFDSASNPAKGVVLGVVKFLEHGVVAAPIKLECANRKDRQAWLSGISMASGESRVLCARGYRSAGGDCVAINQTICDKGNIPYCAGFPSDKYKESEHTLNFDDDTCMKYLCTDNTKAFASATDTTCSVTCATDRRSYVDPKTGLCEKCETGKIVSKNTKTCVPAKAYTKENMLYGPNIQQNKSKPVKEQCWTKFGQDYVNCVKGTL